MKILLVNTYDFGGAATACRRLHVGLIDAKIESRVLLRTKTKTWPGTFEFISSTKPVPISNRIGNKAKRIAKELKLYHPGKKVNAEELFLKNRPRDLEMFSFPQSDFDITESELYQEADIINLHWVANFIDLCSFFKKNTKPVVWTLHDMNPFTGGEHYEEEYFGIDRDGKPLKRELSKEEKYVSEVNLLLKKDALTNIKDLSIVAPSQWLSDEAKKSELLKPFPVHHIPNGLDSSTFKPLNKVYARRLLNIPENKKVILFAADSINNQRKGFIYLKKAFKELSDTKDVLLCTIGKKTTTISEDMDIIHLGVINDERLMSAAYNAADVYVIPSLMDNLPNTVIESLMCGTPVIGFPVGGISEMITNEENGLLTREISVTSLAEALNSFLTTPERFTQQNIRTAALKKYDDSVQADKYVELFKEILSRRRYF